MNRNLLLYFFIISVFRSFAFAEPSQGLKSTIIREMIYETANLFVWDRPNIPFDLYIVNEGKKRGVTFDQSDLDSILKGALVLANARDLAIPTNETHYEINVLLSAMYQRGSSFAPLVHEFRRIMEQSENPQVWIELLEKADPELRKFILLDSGFSYIPTTMPGSDLIQSRYLELVVNSLANDPIAFSIWINSPAYNIGKIFSHPQFLKTILDKILSSQFDAVGMCLALGAINSIYYNLSHLEPEELGRIKTILDQEKERIDNLKSVPASLKQFNCGPGAYKIKLDELVESIKDKQVKLSRGNYSGDQEKLKPLPVPFVKAQCIPGEFESFISLLKEKYFTKFFVAGRNGLKNCSLTIFSMPKGNRLDVQIWHGHPVFPEKTRIIVEKENVIKALLDRNF